MNDIKLFLIAMFLIGFLTGCSTTYFIFYIRNHNTEYIYLKKVHVQPVTPAIIDSETDQIFENFALTTPSKGL